MSFGEVADIVPGGLPPAAFRYRAWWANDATHVQARDGWLGANWRSAGVNMHMQEVTFLKEEVLGGAQEAECLCGCGQAPEGGDFVPGHDQRLRTRIEQMAGGLMNLQEIIDVLDRYVAGELIESELAQQVRKLWPT
jgi:hypothetical protein